MKMTMQEALDQVLADIEAMTPEQFHAEMEKHRNGEIATALRETSEFFASFMMNKSLEEQGLMQDTTNVVQSFVKGQNEESSS